MQLKKHIQKDSNRPSLTGKDVHEEIEEILNIRELKYAEACDIVINTEGMSISQICIELQKRYDNQKSRICACINENDIDSAIRSIQEINDADMIELRADYINDLDEEKINSP